MKAGSQVGRDARSEVAEARAEVARITDEREALLKRVRREAGQKADRLSSQLRERAAKLQRATEAFKRELDK